MILIYGAYGFTGKQVVGLLSKENVEYSIGGRNGKKILELFRETAGNRPKSCIVASPWELSKTVKEEFGLIINTAGPFSDIGEHVVRFAHEIGANYIDCSGEAFWTMRLLEKYSETFSSKGTFISSGVGWETVAGETITKKLIKEVGDKIAEKDVRLVYLADFNMSPGTLQSSVNILRDGAIRWEKGVFLNTRPLDRVFYFTYGNRRLAATNVSTSDVINVPIAVGSVRGRMNFEVFFATRRIYVLARKLLLSALKRGVLSSAVKKIFDMFPEPDDQSSPATAIAMLMEGEREICRKVLDTKGPYRITARILAFFAKAFWEGRIRASGYKAPTELLEFPDEIFF